MIYFLSLKLLIDFIFLIYLFFYITDQNRLIYQIDNLCFILVCVTTIVDLTYLLDWLF